MRRLLLPLFLSGCFSGGEAAVQGGLDVESGPL